MSGWMLTGVIAMVLGVIVGNLLLLKQTARLEMKKPETHDESQAWDDED